MAWGTFKTDQIDEGLAFLDSQSWANDYRAALQQSYDMRSDRPLYDWLATAPQRYADFGDQQRDWDIAGGVLAQIQSDFYDNPDLFPGIEINRDVHETLGEVGAGLATVGLIAGAVYAGGTLIGAFGTTGEAVAAGTAATAEGSSVAAGIYEGSGLAAELAYGAPEYAGAFSLSSGVSAGGAAATYENLLSAELAAGAPEAGGGILQTLVSGADKVVSTVTDSFINRAVQTGLQWIQREVFGQPTATTAAARTGTYNPYGSFNPYTTSLPYSPDGWSPFGSLYGSPYDESKITGDTRFTFNPMWILLLLVGVAAFFFLSRK